MTDMNNREKAFENKYANDQETLFKIESRASKLLGLWAAQEMGMTGADAESYSGEVIASNLKEPGLQDVIDKVSADFAARNQDTGQISIMMTRFLHEAEEQFSSAA